MRKLLAGLPIGILGCFFWLGASLGGAQAQGVAGVIVVSSCGNQTLQPWSPTIPTLGIITVDTTGKACVNATVSASISGFRPAAYGTPIPVTTGGATGTVPAGSEVVATNVGTTNGAFCALGASATTSDQYIAPNGGWFGFGISGDTQLTCITSTGTTTINTAGGAGLPTGTGGGGGSGGGGGGAVFGPTAVGSAAANPPVLLAGTANGAATGNVQVAKVDSAGEVSITAASSSIQPGAFAVGSIPSGANTVEGTVTTAHGCSIAGYTIIGCLGQIDDDVKGPITAGTATIGSTYPLPYPLGAVPLTASATGTTAATTATLAGTSGKTTYICGYSIRANATANTNVTDTLTGVITGTMSSALWVPANTAALGVDEQIFSPCIPASAANTGISAVSGAPGTGGVVTVKAWGFQL